MPTAPAVEVAWVDMRGTRTGEGKRSRLHRLDSTRHRTTICGADVPRFGRTQFASHFEITAAESRGRCLRCFPWTCVRCRERRFMLDAEHRPFLCCSSHGKRLCHTCYRLTHFVEVCAEGCTRCAAEGLPVIYPATRVARAAQAMVTT